MDMYPVVLTIYIIISQLLSTVFHGKDISYYAVAGSLTFIHEFYNFQLAIAYIIIM